jgi:3,4-dihydroxy-2-butanone 4-phosphate synthase
MSTRPGSEVLARVERAIAAVAAGHAVVVVDDSDRENEGDLILAAEAATPGLMGFVIRHTSGLVCVAADGATLDRLALPLMVADNRDAYRTAYTITVDAADGVTTGISAADRALTARVLADPASVPSSLTRPGHVLPLRAVVEEGRGVVVYLRGHEGRGIGLAAKLSAYALQDAGRDTVDANLDQGLPADSREYTAAAHVLRDLGVGAVRLLTNNPAKVDGLRAGGADVVDRVPLAIHPAPDNVAYLRTKRDRMGHDLPNLDLPDPEPEGDTVHAADLTEATR